MPGQSYITIQKIEVSKIFDFIFICLKKELFKECIQLIKSDNEDFHFK